MAEQNDARELDQLRRWKREASALFDGLQDLGRALGLPLGVLITGPAAVVAAEELRGIARRSEQATERAAANERARIAWWLRAAADGPAAPRTHPEYLQAMHDLADALEHHPERWAEAPIDRPCEESA